MDGVARALAEDPRIITPSRQQLVRFRDIFERRIQADEKLKQLEIDETYKAEFFNISGKIDRLSDQMSTIASPPKALPKELTALVKIPQKAIVAGRRTCKTCATGSNRKMRQH